MGGRVSGAPRAGRDILPPMAAARIAPPSTGRLEETKRIKRVLDLVQLVAGQPRRWLRRDLAERFDVSTRQIDKDLELIRHGLVLDLRHAPEGYYFDRLPRLASAPLAFEEALALLLAAQLARTTSGVDSADLQAAIARLEAQLPVTVRDFVRRATRAAPGDAGTRHRSDVLQAVGLALANRRKVAVTYASASRGGTLTERIIRPYALLPYGRSWHVVAYCEARSDVRLFKADRIRALAVVAETYAIPADFDLDGFLGDGWGLLRVPGAPAERVTLDFDATAGRWVSEERWHARQVLTPLAGGGIRFEVDVPVTHELVRWVLSYGRHVAVVGPASLRATVAAEARTIVDAAGPAPP